MKSVANQRIVAIVTTAVIFFLLLSNGVQAQVEGTPCTDDTPCDTANTFLKCDVAAGVCRCPVPTTQYFDIQDNRCHWVADEECNPGDTHQLQCPAHGWCDTFLSPPYLCQCIPPYLETVSKRCAIPHGEQCYSNSDCNYGGFVQCLPGTPQTCGCDPATSKYDPDTEQCFFTLNAECLDPTDTVPHQLCAPGSDCTNEGDGLKCHCVAGSSDNGLGECRANQGEECDAKVFCNDGKYLDCVNNVCGCDPAKHKLDDGNGGCTGDFEADCNDESFCNGKPFLDCINQRCDCKDDLENVGGVCTSKFGGSCAEGEPCHTDKWVDCVSDICTCDVDKHMIPDGTGDGCTGNFEAPCDQGQPCDGRIFLDCIGNDKCGCRSDLDNIGGVCTSNMGGTCENGEPCNGDKWLQCIDKTCTCDTDNYMVDDGNGGCIGKINAPCHLGQPCDKGSFLVCKDNVQCDCKDGMAADSNEICKSKFEGPCADGELCDESKFLTCDPSDQKCRCPIDETIDVGAGDCKALYQKPCDETGMVAPDCDSASNLQCVNDKCECLPGSIPIGDGRCGATLGSNCTSDTDCGTGTFLECGNDNKCVCMEGFDPVNNMCLGSYGTSCDGNGVICNSENFLECSTESKVCECRPDLIVIGGGVCRSAFDGVCGTGQPLCDETSYLECDEETHKCRCQDGLEPTPGIGCAVGFGASCANGELCNPAKFLECGDDKTCVCMAGFDPVNNVCLGSYGTPCDGNGVICNTENFLECKGNYKCDCRSDLVNIGGVCTSNSGGSCAAGEPCNADKWLKCIENICTCDADDHMVDDGNGNCIGQINAPCNQGQPCDPRQLLVCLTAEGKCGCEVGTIFDPVTQKCVRNDGDVRPGDPCQSDGDCKSDTTFMECDLEAVPFSQCRCQGNETAYFESADAKCHKFAHEICDESGGMACPLNGGCDPFEVPATCKCFETHDFHETSTKKCAKPHGATCADSTECDRDSFMGCGGAEEGKCGCGDMDAWFNPTTKTCLLLADSSCNPDHNVTEKPQACAPNSFCSFIDQRCHCEDGLYQNDQRLCFLKAGEPCNPLDDDDLCDVTQFHSCDPVDAKCTCAREETVVEEFAGMCRIRANAECSLNLGAQECTTHSTCVPGDSSHFCECDAGLVPSKVGKCVLTYGLPCGGDIRGTCDSEGFQSCQEGRCTCLNEDQMEYEPAFEECSLKLSSPCVPGGVIACKEHSHCDPAIQKCQCNQGWIEDGQGNCVDQGQFWSLTKVMGRAR